MHAEIREYLSKYSPSCLPSLERIENEIEALKSHGIELIYSIKIDTQKLNCFNGT
jgi:hypothetical protein